MTVVVADKKAVPSEESDSDSEDERERKLRTGLELFELNRLKILKEQGAEVDEELMRELQLFDYERRGVELEEEDLADLLTLKTNHSV